MDQSKALAALSALANETRLALIRLLITRGETGLAAGQIAGNFGISSSRLSFHLSALEQAGLIRARRESRNIFYAVDHATMGGLIAYLLEDCCKSDPQVSACCAHRLTSPAR